MNGGVFCAPLFAGRSRSPLGVRRGHLCGLTIQHRGVVRNVGCRDQAEVTTRTRVGARDTPACLLAAEEPYRGMYQGERMGWC
jgi:hypothetical protein